MDRAHSWHITAKSPGPFNREVGIVRGEYLVFGSGFWKSYSCSSHGHRQQERELGNPLL